MQGHARVVVIGGGAVGAGVLYGLAKRGWRDVVLLERTQLTAGSTWHAAGLIPSYARSHSVARLINRSIEIYSGLEAETGEHIGWHPCGQLRTASTPGRLDEYRSYMDVAAAQGANAHLLTAEEVREIWPYLENPRVLAGLYHPDDGHIAPAGVTMAMVAGARALGARIHQQTEVTGFARRPSGEWEVQTNRGSIIAEHVVLATGNYARQTGAMLGLDIPAIPIVHQYWTTTSVPEIVARKAAGRPELPILRDEEYMGYIREEGDGLMFGPYERPENLELFAVDGVPEWFGADLLEEDFASVEPQWETAVQNVPMLGRAGIRANVRGPFQMTADEMPLCGPAWGLDNIWLAEGVPGGILWGGALGDALADWITTGTTPIDMTELDPRRYGAHCTKEWTRQSVIETWGTHADLHFPFGQPQAGRPQKTVPGHELLVAAGAAFGVVNGWEVPMWYAPEGGPSAPAASFGHGPEYPLIAAEAAAVRTAAGLIDQTALAKYEVTGPGATAWLDRILASRLPDEGHLAPALMLNAAGGVLAAFTLARIGGLWYLTTDPGEERRAFDHLRRALPPDGTVRLDNVTDQIAVLTLAGPRVRQILAQITEEPCSPRDLPPGSLCLASCGLVPGVRILCDGDLGEVALQLHLPMGYHRHLLGRLLAVEGLRPVGSRAVAGLRREKARPSMGAEMNPSRPALESGVEALIDLGKTAFVGREALARLRGTGPGRQILPLRVLTEGASLRGDETIWCNGVAVGRVTSGGWSSQTGHDLALALMPAGFDPDGGLLSVTVLGVSRPAILLAGPAYDPGDARLAL